jgi:hypothetical protein
LLPAFALPGALAREQLPELPRVELVEFPRQQPKLAQRDALVIR